jgi:DNA adenine methylase
MTMKITALAPWFGSKRSMAPEIVEQLGPHRCYWEPFCGSMAVLLAKPEVSQETVNDLHGDLINLGRCIQHPQHGPWLYRQLRRALVHETAFQDAAEQVKRPGSLTESDILDPQRAYWFFYASWMGRNGVIGTKEWNNNFCTRYTMNGGIQGTRFASAVDSIPAWRRRMREVTILRKDGFALLEKIEDQDGVAIYADPPYLTKGATYRHDFEPADHQRLAQVLSRFRKARVVVSYYDHPQLQVLYPGWTKLDCSRAKSLSVQGQRGSKSETAPEVLLLNGPVFGREETGGLFS